MSQLLIVLSDDPSAFTDTNSSASNALMALLRRLTTLLSYKHFRRVATRFEKLASNHLAMVVLASIRIWLRIQSKFLNYNHHLEW